MSAPIPADAVYEFSRITDLALAPDGDRVAFVTAEYDSDDEKRRSSLYVVPTDSSRSPHRLTRASDASQPVWSPCGSKLGFVAARDRDLELSIGPPDEKSADEDDGENGSESDDEETGGNGNDDEPKSQLWVFDLERGGDARQITDRDEGIREFDWGPDGERVVVSARDPTEEEQEYLDQRREDGPIETERLQHKSEGVGWNDSVTSYLFVVDLDTREHRRLDDAYGQGASEPLTGLQPSWSPDGERIAFVSNRTDRPDDSASMDIYVVSPDGGDTERLTDGDVAASDLDWSPDSRRLTFASWQPDNWYVPQEVYVLDAVEGAYESVSGSLDRTISWFGTPTWLDAETVVAGIADEGWTRLVTFDASGDDPTPVEGLDRSRSVGWLDASNGTVVCSIQDPATGHDLYTLSRESLGQSEFDESAVRLTDLHSEFVESWPIPTFHRVTATHDDASGDDDGPVEVESMVYCPPEFDPNDPDPRPVILWPHGGPMSYDDPEFSFSTAYFTSRGYIVCKPNYRGSTSYGRAFCETLRGRWGSVEVVDQLAAIDDLEERGWVDPDRLFVTGFSYGGISTGFIITETDRFTAAAPEHGIYDRRSAFGTDDSQVWTSNDLGLPWEDPEAFEASSSITAVDRVETPTLVTAGGQDWRCPPTQAEQLYVSIRKQGIPAKLVVYPDEGHDVGDPDRAIHRLESIRDWFDRFDAAESD